LYFLSCSVLLHNTTGRKNGFGRGLQQPLVAVAYEPRLKAPPRGRLACAGAKDL
jgi:hypothetical protein